MPVKQKHRKTHHATHKKEKRTKRFLKVYAPYIPLLLIVGCGLFVSLQKDISTFKGQVESYATDMTDGGLLEETNKERVKKGLKPLTLNTDLDAAAQAKANDMASRNYWSHNTPDGVEPWFFIEQTDYKYRKAAENLAYGFNTSQTTVGGWMNSPGHRANILDKDLEEVGFGFVNVEDYQKSGQQTVVVAMYGQALNAATASSVPIPTPTTSTPAQQQQNVSYIESVTGGAAPWAGFAIGLGVGVIFTYLVIAHVRGVRRALRTSENFVIHHPLFDVTMVALIVLAVIVSQNIGSIY